MPCEDGASQQVHPAVTVPTQVGCLQMVFPEGLGDSLRILLLNQAFCSTGRDPAAGAEPCSCTTPGTRCAANTDNPGVTRACRSRSLTSSRWHHWRLASSQQEKLKNRHQRTNHRKHVPFWDRKDLLYSTRCRRWNTKEGCRFGT